MRGRLLPLATAALLLSACGAATAAPSPVPATPVPAATPTPTPSPVPTTPAPSGSAWTITAASKATASVREQLVGVSFPSDAVLVTKGASGSFSVSADGTFSPDSKITFDLTTIASDQRNRDDFVKQDTLQVRQFPTAVFVPVKATGMPSPLPVDADMKFTLAGKMTIHGVTKDATFDIVAKRSGGNLTVTATLGPTWKFGDFGMRIPSVPFRVVSVVDEIRLVVELVATGPAT